VTTPLFTYVVKTNVDVRNDVLRTIKNGLIALGIPNPNVGPNSDYFLTATALGNEIAVGLANITISVDQNMPDTATGDGLDRWLKIVGLARRPAIGSFGAVTISVSVASTLVVTGMQLVDAVGLRYQVTVGGSYANGAPIPVAAIDTGKATNHANGETLTWVTAPAFAASTVSVGTTGGTDGLTGGFDSEVGIDEPPRARLISDLQNPPKGGNSADVILWCLQSSPVVQAAWCYPALLGPGTTFAAVAAQPQTTVPLSATSKSRQLSATLMTGTVQPYVQGQLPEHVFSVIASVVDQSVDVAIQLALPSAPTASPPGPGGGWLDGTPWPSSLGGTAACAVTAVTNSTQFTVNATTAPQDGVSHIAWLSPSTGTSPWALFTATVVSHSGSSGAYVITIDTPMPGIANGNFIWPQATQQVNYINALLLAFSLMGPGEWTSNAAIKARAFRHPSPTQSWPYSLGAQQLKLVINAGPEVLDAQYIFRSATTPTVPASVTVNTSTGALTSAAVNIFVPNNVAFYAV
jgi:uncharacterized phage protein gp47/JayE